MASLLVLGAALAAPAPSRPVLATALGLLLAALASLVVSWRQMKRFRRQLAARDAMLHAALLSTPALTLDRQGAVRRLNGAAIALFGLPREAALGRAFAELTPEFHMDLIRDQAVTTGLLEPRHGQWSGRRADGESFPLSIRFGLIPHGSDEEYLTLTLTDLTQSRAAEAQARELHAQLNKVWRLNSLGEMAATLAHELNQPLSAATTYLHAGRTAIDKAGLDPDGGAGRTLDLAKGQLLRAGKIIRRMRELLTIETSVLAHEHAASMLEDLAPILVMIGRDKKVEVRFDAEAQGDLVHADRIQFQQALVNLVRNAVEAVADRPDPLVQVVGRAMGEAYRISVEDNGPGVAEADLETIFQPLTTTKSGGMGLGLSVTRTIVERHGGALRAERSPSLGGAAFAFNLRRHEAPAAS